MTLPDSSYRKESWRCCCTWVVVERWDYVGWHPKSLSFHHSDNPRTSNGLKKAVHFFPFKTYLVVTSHGLSLEAIFQNILLFFV